MKIWQRYLFGRLIRTFLFFLSSILILYIAVDFSLFGVRILSKVQIGKFIPLFFSLSFLLASLRVLFDCVSHGEITALQIAGLSSKKLLSPFFFLAAFLGALTLANFQWFTSEANDKPQKVLSISLKDGSELVYQKFDKNELFDVFWIRSFDEIWHMKSLKVSPPVAQFVDCFIRDAAGVLEKKESHDQMAFFELEPEMFLHRTTSLENRSLNNLWKASGADSKRASAYLHYKLALPVIPFVLVFILAPFAFKRGRGRSTLLFIACSLFLFVGLMTLLDAMLILAENLVLPAVVAIWVPVLLCSILGLFFFMRMR